jgi:hypothetical protein
MKIPPIISPIIFKKDKKTIFQNKIIKSNIFKKRAAKK